MIDGMEEQCCPSCGIPWSAHGGIAVTCKELESVRSENDDMKAEIADLKKQIEQIEDDAYCKDKRLSEQRKEIESLEDRIDKLGDLYRGALDTLDELEGVNESLQSQMDDLRDQIEESLKERE